MKLAYRYRSLADKLLVQMEKGGLLPGDRLPSVRRLSRQERVSMTTVLHAYGLLQDLGMIESRPQSGYFVAFDARRLPPEPTISRPVLRTSRVDRSDAMAALIAAARDPQFVPLDRRGGQILLQIRHQLLAVVRKWLRPSSW